MATSNLNFKKTIADDGLDSIVIVKNLADIPGGRTLDVSEWDTETFGKFIKAGHFVLKDRESGAFLPYPLYINDEGEVYYDEDEVYGDMLEIVGVLKTTISVDDPRAASLTVGQVNAAAVPYRITSGIWGELDRSQINFINFDKNYHFGPAE